MPDQPDWPELPEIAKDDPQASVKQALYQAQLDWIKAQQQADIAAAATQAAGDLDRHKLLLSNDFAQSQAIMSAYLDVAKGQIDRVASRAQFIQTAASAISTLYIGILGFSFAIDKGAPLPARGIASTFFLGLAIVLATVFLAYLTIPPPTHGQEFTGLITEDERISRDTFILWTRNAAVGNRLYFLHGAVVSLGFGVLFLPAPYISGNTTAWNIGILVAAVAAVALTVLLPLIFRSTGTQQGTP